MEGTKTQQSVVQGEASESDEDSATETEHAQVKEPTKTQQSVVQGEASESDEDSATERKTTQETGKQSTTKVIIVEGEASESEEDEERDEQGAGGVDSSVIPPLTVDTAVGGDNSDITNGEQLSPVVPASPAELSKPKYNTLLHKKLRERNVALRRHLVDTISQTYSSAAKELHNHAIQLQKTQIAIQDVLHHTGQSNNDLFTLEDKLDIVMQCTILPDINIDLPGPPTPES